MVFDCSFDLMKPAAGEQQYLQAHIPGAVYAQPGHRAERQRRARCRTAACTAAGRPPASGGRHPLPSREKFAIWLSGVGFANDMQAVVYDRNGANYCGRLWWMLKWAGHDAVAVLDGGLQAWQAAGGAVDGPARSRRISSQLRAGRAAAPAGRRRRTSQRGSGGPAQTLIDARAAPRFRGEVEPLDPVAGHIPGALNRPFSAEHRRRRPVQAGGAAARGVRRAAGRPRPGRAWCTTAAAASARCRT